MEAHIKIAGIILMSLSGIHIIFPKYFKWDKELSMLSLINRQMVYVHTFFIALVILLMGLLCLTSPNDLINTDLGKKISLGFGMFWTTRLFIQFFGYSTELWKHKIFETIVHVSFSFLWTYLSVLFLVIFFN